jgi:hypothetical protein
MIVAKCAVFQTDLMLDYPSRKTNCVTQSSFGNEKPRLRVRAVLDLDNTTWWTTAWSTSMSTEIRPLDWPRQDNRVISV